MKCIAVDDEEISLELLSMTIKEGIDNVELSSFLTAKDALEYVKNNSCDVAFLDIYMKEMDGIELAEKLKEYNTNINIIFVTGDSEHLTHAIRLHASGYVTKPVTKEKVCNEIENLLHPIDQTKHGIYAHTFGYFDLYVDGKAVKFERKKAKELLAILIDKDGASITTEQIASMLFEDKLYDRNVKNQVTSITSSLIKTLKSVNIEHILIKTWGHLQIDKSAIKCDAYDYNEGKSYALKSFHGEYMTNYSWGEERLSEFYWANKEYD